jgi:hypothetical protein
LEHPAGDLQYVSALTFDQISKKGPDGKPVYALKGRFNLEDNLVLHYGLTNAFLETGVSDLEAVAEGIRQGIRARRSA